MDAKLNRTKLSLIIGKKQWTAKELYNRWKVRYGAKMGYTSFMELLNNNVGWKLSYAFALSEMLEVDIYELFEFITDDQMIMTELSADR